MSIPDLPTPPYFMANLKREINRLERGVRKPDWSLSFFPRLALLGSGFTAALILGTMLFQPVAQQANMASLQESGSKAALIAGEPVLQPPATKNNQPAPVKRHQQAQPQFAFETSNTDTAVHKLPERPGQDQIHINNDPWPTNQVSLNP
jgi:hypothetical protein